MVGWHHQLSGHEFEQTLGDSERQGSLVCCSSWGHKELDMTEQLNNNKQHRVTSAPPADRSIKQDVQGMILLQLRGSVHPSEKTSLILRASPTEPSLHGLQACKHRAGPPDQDVTEVNSQVLH